MDIAAKTAFVTGASSGLGRHMAERLAAAGAHLGLMGRDAHRLEETAASCRVRGVNVACSAGDVGVAADVNRAFATFAAALSPVDTVADVGGISLWQRARLQDIAVELRPVRAPQPDL